MNPAERRLSIRKPLEHLAYLSLPAENGGIVIDVSEGGLGFRSIAPLEAEGPIHFRFSFGLAGRISAVGELAWIDETGKAGGLRFTQLPESVREQIRVWAVQPKESAHAGGNASVKPGSKARGTVQASASAETGASAAGVLVAEPVAKAVVTLAGKAVASSVEDLPPAAPMARAAIAPRRGAAVLTAAAARYNPRLYNLRPPLYSAPYYDLSMFPPWPNYEAPAAVLTAPQPAVAAEVPEAITAVAVLQSAAAVHPIAAIGLTIVLAFLVSMGIFSLVFASRASELLVDSSARVTSASCSQQNPPEPAPPVSAPGFSKAPLR